MRFVATYNDSAVKKFTEQGLRPLGRQLSFYEDDEKSAHIFFKRYTRNLFGVRLTEIDYSIYAPHEGAAPQFGFLSGDAP